MLEPPIEMTADQGQYGLKYFQTKRGPVAYRDCGQGECVILVHRSVSDLGIWQPLIPRLNETFPRHRL